MSERKIPFNRALLWILGSTLLISGTAFMGWLYFLHLKERRMQDDQYRIVALVQSTPQADALKTAYLAEILDLSIDHPANLYQFNAAEGMQTLQSNPLIKEAAIRKIHPGTLLINYQMRTPVAYLGENANTAIDEEGILFPFCPFFTPKRLPILYLGIEYDKCKWGNCLKGEPSLQKAFSIIQEFDQIHEDRFRIKQIDLSQAVADSYGQRQIVVVLEESSQEMSSKRPSKPLYLRLNSDETAQGLINFHNLQTGLFEIKADSPVKEQIANSEGMIIDLRIPHLAFIKRYP